MCVCSVHHVRIFAFDQNTELSFFLEKSSFQIVDSLCCFTLLHACMHFILYKINIENDLKWKKHQFVYELRAIFGIYQTLAYTNTKYIEFGELIHAVFVLNLAFYFCLLLAWDGENFWLFSVWYFLLLKPSFIIYFFETVRSFLKL